MNVNCQVTSLHKGDEVESFSKFLKIGNRFTRNTMHPQA